jgi:hypothetical protein
VEIEEDALMDDGKSTKNNKISPLFIYFRNVCR